MYDIWTHPLQYLPNESGTYEVRYIVNEYSPVLHELEYLTQEKEDKWYFDAYDGDWIIPAKLQNVEFRVVGWR